MKARISEIRKRDGRIEEFEREKITNAIYKAIVSVGVEEKGRELAEELTEKVVTEIEKYVAERAEIPSVEDVQDVVEHVLIKEGFSEIAKAYILYRQQRADIRGLKKFIGVKDDLKLSLNAAEVLKRRYLLKDEVGKVIESPSQMFERVATAIARTELNYGKSKEGLKEIERGFYQLMRNLEFLPNSPTLMNAGTELGQLAACFTGEQLIFGNPGIKQIRDLKIGEKVVTHKERLRTITAIFKRKVSEEIYKIKVLGLFKETLSVTKEHPVLSVKIEELKCLRNSQRLCNGFPKKYCYKLKGEFKNDCPRLNNFGIKPKWRFVNELKRGDFIVTSFDKTVRDVKEIKLSDYLPRGRYILLDKERKLRDKNRPNQGTLIPDSIKIDNDFMRLVGYWLAEGSLSSRYEKKGPSVIRFTFFKEEEEYAEDVLSIMKRKFNLIARKEINDKQHTLQLRFHSNLVATFWKSLFNAGFNKKDVPPWFMELPREKQFNLIVGLFRGDGCYHHGKKQDNFFISLSNHNLALKVFYILGRLDYYFNISYRKPKSGTEDAYRISTAPSECEGLVKAVTGEKNIRKRKRFPQHIKLGGYTLRPIKEIKKEFYEGLVYNLEVDQDHSYVANGVAVHNCFVLPVEDSIEGIFGAVKNMAKVHQSGGGTGFSFSRLRPKGDVVKSTGGVASGPVSFMRVFDVATDVIKQGGKRRGANMGILNAEHPDILEFIRAKERGEFANFNTSVAVTDEFMHAVERNEEYGLVNPRKKEEVKSIKAREVFNEIVTYAWKTGDPGIVFLDEINRHNPISAVGKIEATNPCLTADTWVMTAEGPRQVEELIGKKFVAIVNGEEWESSEDGFFETGVKPVYRLKTAEGFELRLTADHLVMKVERMTRYGIKTQWGNAGDLKLGDKIIINNHRDFGNWSVKGKYTEGEGYLIGLLLGDGTIKKLNPRKKAITEKIERSSADFCRGLLRGLFDADGSVQGNQSKGISVRLAQSDLEILKAVQRMLLRFGVFSKIYRDRRKKRKSKLPDGKGGVKGYITKPQHELVISKENILYFAEKIGFDDSEKMEKLEKVIWNYKRKMNRERFVASVTDIVPDDVEKVYDVQIPGINAFDANGFVVHNCGEQPLLPYESCNLGSINVSKFVENGEGEIDWERLREVIWISVRFLDDVIDVNRYPLPEIDKMTKANRKIGLGIMGFAELLIKLGIAYDSKDALSVGEKLMQFITNEARQCSTELGLEKGSFSNFGLSVWNSKYEAMRNATVTTIAPTGTISIIGGCSSGIEPIFAVAFVRNVMGGMLEINKLFEEIAKERGFYSKDLITEIAKCGSIQDIEGIPEDVKRIFVTALDISPDWHVRMQAAFQKYTDNSVSKTVNQPSDATWGDVKRVFLLAYKLKCKGVTVYRYGSKEQVLSLDIPKLMLEEYVCADSEYAGECRICSV